MLRVSGGRDWQMVVLYALRHSLKQRNDTPYRVSRYIKSNIGAFDVDVLVVIKSDIDNHLRGNEMDKQGNYTDKWDKLWFDLGEKVRERVRTIRGKRVCG